GARTSCTISGRQAMVSIAKAIPSLLELAQHARLPLRELVSIAKAIPSLLERAARASIAPSPFVSIAKAIPSLLEPELRTNKRGKTKEFQSRKRFRHCWSGGAPLRI